MLFRRGVVKEMDVVLDASFIKAWSIRYPRDNRRGYSDPDAWVGRYGRGYDLGYKFHVSVDHRETLHLASVLAPANENEKKHGPTLVERTKEGFRRAGTRLRCLVVDSQYSSGRMRELVDEAVIPFMTNQRQGEDVLRVDRKFRTHRPEERVKYNMRPAVEAAYAFLKTQYRMAIIKVQGLRSLAVYALYSVLCHMLTKEAAKNIGRPDKAISLTFVNTLSGLIRGLPGASISGECAWVHAAPASTGGVKLLGMVFLPLRRSTRRKSLYRSMQTC